MSVGTVDVCEFLPPRLSRDSMYELEGTVDGPARGLKYALVIPDEGPFFPSFRFLFFFMTLQQDEAVEKMIKYLCYLRRL